MNWFCLNARRAFSNGTDWAGILVCRGRKAWHRLGAVGDCPPRSPFLAGGIGGMMETLLETLEFAEAGGGGGTTIAFGMGRAPAGGGMETAIDRALRSSASLVAFSTIAFCFSSFFARMGTRSSGIVCFNCIPEG